MMNYVRTLMLSLTLLCLIGVLAAAANVSNIRNSLYCLYQTVKSVLAVGLLLLVVLAAIVYSIGQILGAETRARASVWATAMFVGAIIGAIIFLVLPYVLRLLFAGEQSMVDELESPDPPSGVSC